MKHKHFEISINASKEKVWDVLWNDKTYPVWTSVFCEGSSAQTDWNEGSKVLFLDGKGEGMYSQIDKKTEPEFMSFKHIGMVKEGKELPVDEETKKWSGAMENYNLSTENNETLLEVDMDITDDHEKYFDEAFPKGLQKVKELAEG